MKPHSSILPALLCLWWLWVFSALGMGTGLDIPWSRCYAWWWEGAGKQVKPASAFGNPRSASVTVVEEKPRACQISPVKHKKSRPLQKLHLLEQALPQPVLPVGVRAIPSLLPPAQSHLSFLSPVFHLILYLFKESFFLWLVILKAWFYSPRPVLEG